MIKFTETDNYKKTKIHLKIKRTTKCLSTPKYKEAGEVQHFYPTL